jgi:hypothetical protein
MPCHPERSVLGPHERKRSWGKRSEGSASPIHIANCDGSLSTPSPRKFKLTACGNDQDGRAHSGNWGARELIALQDCHSDRTLNVVKGQWRNLQLFFACGFIPNAVSSPMPYHPQCRVILNVASWGPTNASVRGVSEVKDLLLVPLEYGRWGPGPEDRFQPRRGCPLSLAFADRGGRLTCHCRVPHVPIGTWDTITPL